MCGLIEVEPVVGVAEVVDEAEEVFAGEGEGGGVEAGVEAEAGGVAEVLVEEEADVVLGVVDEAEGGDGAGRDAEVMLHAAG